MTTIATSPECVPASLAMYRIRRKRGFEPSLVVGCKPSPFEPHMWVEIEGHVVDVGGGSIQLDRFRRLVDP